MFPMYCWSAEEQNLSISSIEIIVNPSVSDNNYTLSDVRAIFAMRKTHWSDGKKIQVFVLADNQHIHQKFTKSKLNMFPHQFRRIWDRLIFSGTGHAPHEVGSQDEMLEKISTVPNAIGYLEIPIDNEEVKVLTYE